MLYQLWGNQCKPYSVFLRSHYSSSWKYGSPMGDLFTVISSSGRVALHNSFLQSPYHRMRLSPNDLDVRRRRVYI